MSGGTTVAFRAQSAGLAGVELAVDRVHVLEGMDTPFEANVSLRLLDPSADPAAMLGKDFVLELEREGTVRRWTGVVRQLRHGEEAEVTSDGAGLPVEVWVVPALQLLGLRRNTRIFQDQSALDIARAVLQQGLAPFSRELDVRATETYPKREYCVQYQETDLAFVERLLEEEGIAYSFSFEGEREVMVLSDAVTQLPRIANVAGDGVVHFRADDRRLSEHDPVHRFSRRRGTTTTSVVVRDHDFSAPAEPEAEARAEDELGRDRESYEHGHGRSLTIGGYAGTRFGEEDSGRQATLRQEMYRRGEVVLDGEGRAAMAPGQLFELLDHPLVGLDGEYLVTRVEHVGDAGDGAAGLETGYRNRFECIPSSVPYRPRRDTPKPSIPGFETAVVTGPAGEEIHTDEHGRIKVQLHWDRQGQNDDKTTCFLRVRQAWAGASWGFSFIPRIGMHVIVSFLDGDPDRPVVSGCVYDGAHAPPYTLPDEKTKSTIKSQSTIGKASGFNELRFEDKAGSEEIFTHAEKDQNEIVLNNHTTTVGGDQENIVGLTQTQHVHQNQTERVKGDQTMDVGTDRTVHVAGTFHETVAKGEKRNVDTGVTEIITGFEYRNVVGGLVDKIADGELRLIIGGIDETITGLHKQAVTGATTEVMLSGSTQTVTAGPITYDTAGVYTLKSGGPIALNGMAGIKIHAPVQVTRKVKLESDFHPILCKKPKLNAGESVADRTADFWGEKISVVGASMGTSMVKIGLFGVSIGHSGVKASMQGIKVDLYGKKKSMKMAEVSVLTFKFDL
jgi:type VI secretion system secreted protein VgrG